MPPRRKKVPKELFSWDPDEEVYADGTADLVQHPEMAVALAGAVQLDGSEGPYRTAVMSLEPMFPQSAPVAEQVALIDRQRAAADPCLKLVKLVVECSALISTYAEAYDDRIKPNSVNAGYGAQVGNRSLDVYEVQAHGTAPQSIAFNQSHWHRGNQIADNLVQATQYQLQDCLAYKKTQHEVWKQAVCAVAARNTAALIIERTKTTDPKDGAHIVKHPWRRRRHRFRHEWARPPDFPKWGCTQCGCQSRLGFKSTGNRSGACTMQHRAVAHPSHRIVRFGFAADPGRCVFVCSACGRYSTTRIVLLKS
jgi:hypothetical protein